MLNAIGNVIKQADECNKDHLRTASIKADFNFLPNTQKASDSQPDFRVVTEGIQIDVRFSAKAKFPTRDM